MTVLPIADDERLIDLAEDNAAARAEQRRQEVEEYLPAEMVDRLLGGESPLRVWRKHRELTLVSLGKAVGISKSFLSEVETGKRRGAPALWRKLAEALSVTVDDILPTG